MDKNEIKSKLIDMLEELFSDSGVNEVDNSACHFVIYQPKLPKGAEKLRKF